MADEDKKGGEVIPLRKGETPRLPSPPPQSRDISQRSSDELDFIDQMTLHKVKFITRTNTYTIGDGAGCETFSRNALVDRFVLRCPIYVGGKAVQETEMHRLLRVYETDMKAKETKLVRDAIAPVDRERGQAELAKWLDIVCEEGHELSQVIMTQWVWLIRNKLAGRHGSSHIFPVLQGKQGGGKSMAVKALLAPVASVSRRMDFQQILDDRYWFEFEMMLVCHIEELAGAKGKDVEKLKALVTGEYVSARPMRSNDVIQIPQRCTFIGDSNVAVKGVVKDATGGRRWWELRCRDRMDVGKLDTIDYMAIYGCTHEDDPCPTVNSPHFEEIDRLQREKLTAQDTWTLWVNGCEIARGDVLVSEQRLFDHYLSYCREQGIFPDPSRPAFRDYLKRMRFDKVQKIDIRKIPEGKDYNGPRKQLTAYSVSRLV